MFLNLCCYRKPLNLNHRSSQDSQLWGSILKNMSEETYGRLRRIFILSSVILKLFEGYWKVIK